MKPVILAIALIATQATLACWAQETKTGDVANNPHQTHDQRMRDCRKQAQDQQLQKDARRAFIAQCMK